MALGPALTLVAVRDNALLLRWEGPQHSPSRTLHSRIPLGFWAHRCRLHPLPPLVSLRDAQVTTAASLKDVQIAALMSRQPLFLLPVTGVLESVSLVGRKRRGFRQWFRGKGLTRGSGQVRGRD